MKKKHILLIAFLGVSALHLWWPWVECHYRIKAVNEHARPFTANSCPYSSYHPIQIHVEEQYQKLHIKEMSYEREGKTGILLKDKSYELYTEDWKLKLRYAYNPDKCDSIGGNYIFNLLEIKQHVRENVNVDKLFKGKKRGDEFKYTVKIVYSLDDEPESTQIMEYNVEVLKGRYRAFLTEILMWITAPLWNRR
jgi:hypothetical protein